MSNDLSHLGGWVDDQKAVEKIMQSLPFPVFQDVWNPIKDSGKGKIALLYKYVEKVAGKFPVRLQTGPDCVSMGAACAVDISKAIDIALKGDFEEWIAETATENIYSGSRIIIGKGQLGYGGGSIGAWAARFCNEYGALPRQKYGSIDLSVYDGNRAIYWGRPDVGHPKELLAFERKHPILTVSRVDTYEQARDLLVNGYAITVASNQGFSSRRDSEGFAAPQGNWAHQMCLKKDTLIKGLYNKTIEELSVNDLIYDINGNLQKITEIYTRNYTGDIVKLSISGRGILYLTPNHPVLVFRKETNLVESFNNADISLYANKEYKNNSRNSKYDLKKRVCKWVNAEDIRINDWVFCPKPEEPSNDISIKWIHSKRCKNIPNTITIDNKFAWFLGLYAADGTSTKGHKIVITCNKNDTALINSCVSYIENVIGLKCILKAYKNAIRVICYSSIVANTFYDWFKTGKNKRIPRFVMSNIDKESFIKGFFDGDGSIINDGESFKIVNCNPYMVEDLHTLLLQLGYSPYINKFSYKDKEYGNENWSDKFEISWTPSPIVENNWWSKDNYICPVRDIQTEYIDDIVYNLEVENTHTYIANGIVVHNCVIAVDDEYKRPGVLINNSWGVWNGGPKRHGQPDGSFWVDADEFERRILRAGDSWAFSGYQGFEPRKLNTRII